MFYDRLLGTGGLYYQSVYLPCVHHLSFLSPGGKGEKALWQNLIAALDKWVLPMCLAGEGMN